MRSYIIKRILYMIFLLMATSVIAFIIIQLPPGDFGTYYVIEIERMGRILSAEEILTIRKQLGVDLPIYTQYFKWLRGMLQGNFGRSLNWNAPVIKLIADRLPFTLIISLFAIFFTYILAIPIGIYSATHQYSIMDYTFIIIGFAGLAIPNFLFALILMFIFSKYFSISVGGLFSPEYIEAAWSIGKIIDILKHLPIPIIVIGTAGTAGLIRVMRACLLDELRQQYVIAARAKGLKEKKLIFKYPVKVALNPIVSTIGWILPGIISGETITAIVLNLPTTGPLLFGALLNQDIYLAASIIMFLAFFTIIGTFISDILLVIIDPRIRYEKQ